MQLGRYQLLKQLATGTVADVLLARASGLEGFARHVVIKRLRPEMATEERVAKAFLEEARIAGSLHHQNVVTVHDIGEQDGVYFFAMEYVHGEDARRLIGKVRERGEHIPLEHALSIVMAAAAGLHHAHEQSTPSGERLGLVHRDVSPQNILIGYDGSVKLVDFGMAKAAAKSSTTMTGILKGKSSYLSPEQCTGKPVDRRTDVFGLGIVLYELVTAQRLFKGANEFMTMAAIVEGVIPKPSTLRGEVPPALDEIILRALQRSPESRYQTAEALRESLEAFALAQELRTSHKALSDYLTGLFGQRPEPWEVRAASHPQPEQDFETTNAKGLVPTPTGNRGEMAARLALRAESPMMQADADNEWDDDDENVKTLGGTPPGMFPRGSARAVSESQLRTTPTKTVGKRGTGNDDEPQTARDIPTIKRARPEDVTRTEPQRTPPADTATDLPAAHDDADSSGALARQTGDETENLTVLEPATFDTSEPATNDSGVERTLPADDDDDDDDDAFENEVATEIASDQPGSWGPSDTRPTGGKARVSSALIPRSSLPATKRPAPVAAAPRRPTPVPGSLPQRPTPPPAAPQRPTPAPARSTPSPTSPPERSTASPTSPPTPSPTSPPERSTPSPPPRSTSSPTSPPERSTPTPRPTPPPAPPTVRLSPSSTSPPPGPVAHPQPSAVHVPGPQPPVPSLSSPGPGGPTTLHGPGGPAPAASMPFPPLQSSYPAAPPGPQTPQPFGAAAPPASYELRGGLQVFVAKHATRLWIAGGVALVLLVILASRGCGDAPARTNPAPTVDTPAEK